MIVSPPWLQCDAAPVYFARPLLDNFKWADRYTIGFELVYVYFLCMSVSI